jgi:catechol 2,3-dioxygenase-like lactoylglutathione lyase family enzyme
MSTPGSSSGWHFDHVNLAVSQPESLVAFFGDVLGWRPGHRPAFPFPGHWLYDGDAAVLHLQTVAGAKPNARFAHLAFRTERPADESARGAREQPRVEVCDISKAGRADLRPPSGGVVLGSKRQQRKPCRSSSEREFGRKAAEPSMPHRRHKTDE